MLRSKRTESSLRAGFRWICEEQWCYHSWRRRACFDDFDSSSQLSLCAHPWTIRSNFARAYNCENNQSRVPTEKMAPLEEHFKPSINPNNHGPRVIIVGAIMLAATMLMLVICFSNRYNAKTMHHWDSLLILLGAVRQKRSWSRLELDAYNHSRRLTWLASLCTQLLLVEDLDIMRQRSTTPNLTRLKRYSVNATTQWKTTSADCFNRSYFS